MTQVARPVSDVSNSGWGPTPLYPHINTPTPNDASPISCSVPPGGSFQVLLAPMARPITGKHTLTVRLLETPTAGDQVNFALEQGPTGQPLIAFRTVTATLAFTNYDLVLTEDEVDLIADYTKLWLHVWLGGALVPCCANEIPATLYATVSGCSCMAGTYPLTLGLYQPGHWTYNEAPSTQVGVTQCGGNGSFKIDLSCPGSGVTGWQVSVGCGTGAGSQSSSSSSSCGPPISLIFNGFSVTGGCPACGSTNITVTVTS
jgi:hypothetical protein